MKPLGPRSRWVTYGVALVGTLLAVRWAGGQDEPDVRPAGPRPESRAAPGSSAAPSPASRAGASAVRETPPPLDLSRLGARAAGEGGKDLFPAVNWAQAAREEEIKRNPPPKPAPPPPPQAPPLPFTYLGKIVEEGKATVFLVQGDRNLIVREGETVQGSYRIDAIAEQSMTLTYLPLDKQQTLSFAAPAAGGATPPGRPAAPQPQPAEEPRRDD